MKRPPFHIITILFDYIVALVAFGLAAFISIFIIVLVTKNNHDHWRNGIITLNILWPVVFYIMRRRFNFKTTLVQIILSTIITGISGYISLKLLDHSENLDDGITYIVYGISFCMLSIFVFTKQVSDKYFLAKESNIYN